MYIYRWDHLHIKVLLRVNGETIDECLHREQTRQDMTRVSEQGKSTYSLVGG